MKITYQNREIEIKFSFRADMLFEDAVGHSFSGQSETEWLQYFFCTVVAVTKDETLKFEEFVDWISDNPTVFYQFLEWYTDYQKSVLELRKKTEKAPDESKKKVSKNKK